MVNRFLFLLLCLVGLTASAQNSSVSPYSYFGLGEFRSGRTVENNMMGGISTYTDSIHLNFQNPAALGKLWLTTYSAALSHKEIRLEDSQDLQRTSVTNLEYLALAFPISPKMGVGFGLRPYTSVGYDLVDSLSTTGGETVINTYSGQGGLNQVYVSAGFQAAPNLHLGATMNYSFGELDLQRVQSIEGVQYGTLDRRVSDIEGFDFVYGATFTPAISDKLKLYTSFIANTQVNLSAENSQVIGSFSSANGQEIEVVEVDLEQQGLARTDIRVPTVYTAGLGIGEERHWFIGGEYSTQAFSQFQNAFLQAPNVSYIDGSTLAVGGYYIPNYTSFTSYFSRTTYRAGFRLENSGLVVNNKEISNFGITFGLGLPLNNEFSNLNLGFELGRRGTTMNSLVRESYFKVNIGLSFNSKWFQKRQIN